MKSKSVTIQMSAIEKYFSVRFYLYIYALQGGSFFFSCR